MFDLDSILKSNLTFLGSTPKRLDVLKRMRSISSNKSKGVRIHVIRSMPFEFVVDPVNCYLDFSDLKAEFTYSSYDPAMSEVYSFQDKVDVLVLWFDWRLYSTQTEAELISWVEGLVRKLRETYSGHIIVNNWPVFSLDCSYFQSSHLGQRGFFSSINNGLKTLVEQDRGLYLLDLELVLGVVDSNSVWDSRSDLMSSYPFSDTSSILIGRFLANSILAQLFKPRIKAIIVDLDNTLYAGVLGEGLETLSLTEDHIRLQRALKTLKETGVLLGLSSKNDLRDVEVLFETKKMPLALSDFASVKVGWNRKSQSIEDILEEFNFSARDVIFIDDNPSELAEVKTAHEDISLIRAEIDNMQGTLRQLVNFPRLYQLNIDQSAEKRMRDIKANQERKVLRDNVGSHQSYLEQLDMQIGLYRNYDKHIDRIFSLSNKTNQFNLLFSRYTIRQVQDLNGAPHATFTVTLKDKFADSGIVGVFAFSRQPDHYLLEEVLFSCRVLGRGIEYVSFLEALKNLREVTDKIVVRKVVGERNQPALEWFDSIFSREGQHNLDEVMPVLKAKVAGHPSHVNWS